MAHPNLMAWADKQPDWARDALRRHALAQNFELGEDDKKQVMRRVRAAVGISDEDVYENAPFQNDHLKAGAAVGPRTLLTSLGPVKYLARIAPGQKLRFALDGITLIYGDNGTGKSGYCRITKKVCRSITIEDLLGNVFEKGVHQPAEIEIGHMPDGTNEPIVGPWIDGTAPPAAIASISVFDSRNARLYVDAENRIGFLPHEVALLEQFAKHCMEMIGKIETEHKALGVRLKVALPAGYATNGEVAALFARLQPKKILPTEADIRAAAAWTEKDAQELDALEKLLAQDPKALADSHRRAAALLKGYATDSDAIDVALSDDSVKNLSALYMNAKATAGAAQLAATERFKEEPMAGVGLEPWRLMYDYAAAFAKSVGLDALPATEGYPCGLCQQPLSADGAARMQRFAAFVNDAASKAADAARNALDEATEAFKKVTIPRHKDLENALANYRKVGDDQEKRAVRIIKYFERAEARRAGLIAAVSTGVFGDVGELPDAISADAVAEYAALQTRVAELEKDGNEGDAKRVQDRVRLAAMKDRKKLADDLETVLARLVDLEMSAKLTKCTDLLNTKGVSTQITSLRRELVTADLEKRIQNEIEALDLTHLPFRVNDRSAGGQSNFRVVLDTPTGVANDKVLSEGEQKALALACFLGELGTDEAKHGVVIDDPVSSLDHIRIRRVAQRIADEAAKGKQVIIFTHNLLFYNEILEAAARANPQIPVAKRVITKSEEAGFGLISETDEPWIAQKVNDRITRLREKLKKIEGRTDYGTDAYRGAAKDFYTDLRETWERLVEELLLGQVVERFNTDVKTQSLKGVVVEDDDYAKIYWAMKRASERSGHDMAAAKNAPQPKPEDMKADLKELDDYRVAIKKRREETDKRRKVKEKPPEAQVA